ncbi:MAG: hypothetical protein CMH83_17175 [Nocardioides sp.]|nr:hypothetical protein [Nocardioides sp.]
MLITNHVVSGALVGATAPGPVSAFVAGVASHFALDSVPHWGDVGEPGDPVPLTVAVPDGLVGLAVMGHLAFHTPPGHRLRVVAGMAGACLPDADKPSELFFGRSPFPAAFDAFHKRIQRESSDRMPQEFVVAGAGLAVWALWRGAVRRRVSRGLAGS